MAGYPHLMSGDDIYQRLKDDILSLKLAPGKMISENEVANSFNVSRTPVKTAFMRLKGEKYIEIVPQKGTYVTLLDIKYIQDVIYMRTLSEIDMVCTIADNNADEVAAMLQENLNQQRVLIESGEVNPAAFYEVDSRFHATLFKANGREKMWEVIQGWQVYYTRFRILDTMTTSRYRDLYNEHVGIIEALATRDKEKLRERVFGHLHGNLRVLAAKIEGEYRDFFLTDDN